MKSLRRPAFWLFLGAAGAATVVSWRVRPVWVLERVALNVESAADGRRFYVLGEERRELAAAVPVEESVLAPQAVERLNVRGLAPPVSSEVVFACGEGGEPVYWLLQAGRHWGWWSLLPAATALGLCWLTREPLVALGGGVVVGALLLGLIDLTDQVLIPSLASRNIALVLLVYLWMLGGLMGIWSRTGAARAFADWVTGRFVRGPRSAKLAAWFTGVIFFQGGSVSTVLTGTAVKPIADRERVSHEELSYIVDSTASPIALLLAFNAWPGYVQSFIYVAGVPWLATEADRLDFYFSGIPLYLYAWLAVGLTLLMSLDVAPFAGRRLHAAMRRSRETGLLDAPDAEPLGAAGPQVADAPPGYRPHVADFLVPLAVLIATAIGTYAAWGRPRITWAFGLAVLAAACQALARGMSLRQLVEGYTEGLKGVVPGATILVLAVTIGRLTTEAGAGLFLVEQLRGNMPVWLLPAALQVLTMVIAFSTGTSWGTFAVTLPLAMPLAWAVCGPAELSHPRFYMLLCLAGVLNGSVYGDQCSPISDTTVLSAMSTGCDLMDHVRTQFPQATVAAVSAACGLTLLTALAV